MNTLATILARVETPATRKTLTSVETNFSRMERLWQAEESAMGIRPHPEAKALEFLNVMIGSLSVQVTNEQWDNALECARKVLKETA